MNVDAHCVIPYIGCLHHVVVTLNVPRGLTPPLSRMIRAIFSLLIAMPLFYAYFRRHYIVIFSLFICFIFSFRRLFAAAHYFAAIAALAHAT